jgi:hypothetical protein
MRRQRDSASRQALKARNASKGCQQQQHDSRIPQQAIDLHVHPPATPMAKPEFLHKGCARQHG